MTLPPPPSADEPPFTSTGGALLATSELRRRYPAALPAADRHDFGPLLALARR